MEPEYAIGDFVILKDKPNELWWIRELLLQIKLNIVSGENSSCSEELEWLTFNYDNYEEALQLEDEESVNLTICSDKKLTHGKHVYEYNIEDIDKGMWLTDKKEFKAEIVEARYIYYLNGGPKDRRYKSELNYYKECDAVAANIAGLVDYTKLSVSA